MENAGKEDMPDEAERKGLGTPATRAAIIEKLVSGGFVERKGKNLIPTKAGVNLVTVLPELLTSPKLTADWEQRLNEVAKGQVSPEDFMDGIEAMAAELVRKIAENYKLPYYTMSPTYSVCADHGYLSGEQYTCPICGEKTEVYSRITGYYRPVQNWNDGKTQEFKDRKVYDLTLSLIHISEPTRH